MKLKIGLGSMGILVMALAGAAQIAKQYDAEATKSYALPDGTKVTYEGGCSYDEKQITCWNSDGAPDRSMADKIQSHYLSQNGQDLAFGFRKKNRLIVFSRTGGNTGLQINTPDNSFIQVNQLNGSYNSGFYGWANVRANPDATTQSLIVSAYGLTGAPSVRVPFSDGAKITYDGTDIVLGGAKPAKGNEPAQPGFGYNPVTMLGAGKHWLYFADVKRTDGNQVQLSYSAIDKQGNPIKYVDRNGDPVSELTYVKENPQPNYGYYPYNGMSPNKDQKFFMAQLMSNMQQGSVATIQSNINPAQVGFIEVSGTRQCRVLFKDLPLDPK